LKKAHASKELSAIDSAMETINEAWKNASEEMYKAQEGGSQESDTGQNEKPSESTADDDVTDVEFEEVKEEE